MNDNCSKSLDERAIALVRKLDGKWHGDTAMCHCPAHDDRTPSLKVTLGERAILYFCYAGCSQEQVSTAIRKLDSTPLTDRGKAARTQRKTHDFRGLAVEIWNKSLPLKGTLGERYLRSRKIDFEIPEVRFDPACISGVGKDRTIHPALIAAIRDDSGIVAIQRTFLCTDGLDKANIEEPKATLGFPRGGAGRWGGIPRKIVRLAEGVEDAASAMIIASGGLPIWPVFGIKRYGSIDIGDTIERVIIYTQPGAEAANAIINATPHLTANNRELEVVPPFGDGDWNDLLRAIRS